MAIVVVVGMASVVEEVSSTAESTAWRASHWLDSSKRKILFKRICPGGSIAPGVPASFDFSNSWTKNKQAKEGEPVQMWIMQVLE